MAIKLIIGLRNPGSTYKDTRHNAGSWFVEKLASSHTLTFTKEKKLQGELAVFEAEEQSCKLFLPTHFMNHSGLSTKMVSHFYHIEAQEILIVHDDLDLFPGKIKYKTGGGHGGHNGLRDIIQQMNDASFHRLRIGIGHPGDKSQVLNYVLGKPTVEDKALIDSAIQRAVDALPLLLKSGVAAAMNAVNE